MSVTKFNPSITFFLFAASLCSFLISLALLQLFAGLLVIFWLFEKNRDKKDAFDVIGYLFVLFLAFRLASIFLSPYPDVAIQSLYKDALLFLGFFAFSFYLKAYDNKKFNSLVLLFFTGAVVASLIGIILFNLGLVHRAESFTSGYMTFSSFLLAASGIAFFIPSIFEDKLKNWYWTGGSAIIISGQILSLGRTNIALTGLLFVVAIALRRIKLKYAAVIAVITIIVCWLSFMNNQQEVQQRIQNPATLSDRDIIISTALNMMWDTPVFGYGPRTFTQVFPNRHLFADRDISSWHNDFLQMYFDGGIFGLIAFLMLTLIPLWLSWRFYRRGELTTVKKDILCGILFSTGALVLSSVTSGFINSPVLSVVFAFQIAVISAIVFRPAHNVDLADINIGGEAAE